jgi:hypothetical protein
MTRTARSVTVTHSAANGATTSLMQTAVESPAGARRPLTAGWYERKRNL